MLEPRTVARRRRNVGVQVESVEVRLARSARGDPRRVGIAAEPEDAASRAPAEGDTPLHRRARHGGQRARFLGERIGRQIALLLRLQAAATQERADPRGHRGEDARDLVAAWAAMRRPPQLGQKPRPLHAEAKAGWF